MYIYIDVLMFEMKCLDLFVFLDERESCIEKSSKRNDRFETQTRRIEIRRCGK